MTDFEYDGLQKKRIASGASHQKKGSKSRKCSLPHDNLTPAQRRKLDGPVHTYAINRPMCWEAFKALPKDLQQSHLDYIQNRFNIGVNTVSELVFGKSHTALWLHCSKTGLAFQTYRGVKMNPDEKEKLTHWLNQDEAVPAEETVAPVECVGVEPAEEERTEEAVSTKWKAGLSELPRLMCGGEIRMQGLASELLPALVSLVGGNDAYMSVHFRFTSVKEEKDIGRISEK
jgi:hypothetical protein